MASPHASAKELSEHLIRVHSMAAAALPTSIDLLDVCAFVVHLLFLWIAKHRVSLPNVFEHFVSLSHRLFICLLLLVWMPLDSHLTITLFNF